MSQNKQNSQSWVDIDLWCGGERIERLRIQEGDGFEAEVDCADYCLKVVDVREVRSEGTDGSDLSVPRTTECENCGEQRYTFEACNHCGCVHWRDDDE